MNDVPISRKAFLKQLGRYGLTALLAGGVIGLLFSRSGSSDRTRHTCRSNTGCRRCPLAAQCLHPTALSFKQRSGE